MWVYCTWRNYYYVVRLYLITHENSLHLSWILFDSNFFLDFYLIHFCLVTWPLCSKSASTFAFAAGRDPQDKKKQITNILWKKPHARMRPGLEFVIKLRHLRDLSYVRDLFVRMREIFFILSISEITIECDHDSMRALSYAWNLFLYLRYLRSLKNATTTQCHMSHEYAIFFNSEFSHSQHYVLKSVTIEENSSSVRRNTTAYLQFYLRWLFELKN